VLVQRVHGDLHLGQTMRVTSGWKILDFEGEPAKPVSERRALDSPVRDVAGMVRSFDYAARYALGDTPPDPQSVYRAAEWVARNRDAFCAGYTEGAGTDPRDQKVLLRAYEADKVVYEVVYESRHRPHWVSIPMSALERLAG
jgi:maltokinase